jgi:hypothetical protein
MELTVPFTCPRCKRSREIKVREMVPGRSSACSYCNTAIDFDGADGRKLQRALDDLERTLKKGINIRF